MNGTILCFETKPACTTYLMGKEQLKIETRTTMNNIRRTIHTTISKECRDWLHKESEITGDFEGEIIEKALDFYKKNKAILEEYKQARIFLRDLVKSELVEDYTKARPLLSKLIQEELNNKNARA